MKVSRFNVDLNSSKQNENDNVKHEAPCAAKDCQSQAYFAAKDCWSHPKWITSKCMKRETERERERERETDRQTDR